MTVWQLDDRDDVLRDVRPLVAGAVSAGLGSAAAVGVVSGEQRAAFACGRTSRLRLDPALDPLAGPQPLPGMPIRLATPFDLASLTKPMVTVTLLALLLSERAPQVALDRTLAEYLGDAAGTALGGATLRQLLGHCSGANAWTDLAAATADVPDPLERVQVIRRQVLSAPLQSQVGTTAVYSDLGFLALGWVLEHVLGQSLAAAFAERVAKPLDLQAGYRPLRGDVAMPAHATVCTEIWPARGRGGLPLQGEVHDDNAAALGGIAGHAGLFGSVLDVLRWAQVWLDATGDARKDPELPLEPALCRALVTTAQVQGSTWRCGWDTPSGPGSLAGSAAPAGTFGHLGFTGTSVWLSPQTAQGVVLLTNRVHPSREAGVWVAANTPSIRELRPTVADAVWRRPLR